MKYYKVIKENFLWEVGAILSNQDNGQYIPMDDIWKKHEKYNEYLSAPIVEESPEYFERVYKVDLLTRTVYKAKEDAKQALENLFKS